MAQWLLKFRIDVKNVQDVYQSATARKDANVILRAVSGVAPRPIRAMYDDGDGRISVSFVISAEGLPQAHEAQSRIHDAMAAAMDKSGTDYSRYAIEYEHPQEDSGALK